MATPVKKYPYWAPSKPFIATTAWISGFHTAWDRWPTCMCCGMLILPEERVRWCPPVPERTGANRIAHERCLVAAGKGCSMDVHGTLESQETIRG